MIILDISRGKDSMRLGNLLDVETETHRDWEICWMSRPRLIETEKFLGCRDRDSSRLRNLLDVETETHRDLEIWRMSRPRLIETGKFAGCRDRDQSRLGKRCRYRDSIETLAHLCNSLYPIFRIFHERILIVGHTSPYSVIDVDFWVLNIKSSITP